ncbi:hypothetical protein [Sphingomonas sp. 22176]|uniref:hypothetical protein n=1 Tax=Sphingomonas sp. 22176 TaxID=3453884 RepID=UPI003F8312B8
MDLPPFDGLMMQMRVPSLFSVMAQVFSSRCAIRVRPGSYKRAERGTAKGFPNGNGEADSPVRRVWDREKGKLTCCVDHVSQGRGKVEDEAVTIEAAHLRLHRRTVQ